MGFICVLRSLSADFKPNSTNLEAVHFPGIISCNIVFSVALLRINFALASTDLAVAQSFASETVLIESQCFAFSWF